MAIHGCVCCWGWRKLVWSGHTTVNVSLIISEITMQCKQTTYCIFNPCVIYTIQHFYFS